MSRVKLWEPEIVEVQLLGGTEGTCDHCNTVGLVIECDSRRMDSDKIHKLCPHCATEHHTYWDEMWQEYYQSGL